MTRTIRTLAVSIFTALLTLCFSSAALAQTYSITDLGNLGGVYGSQGNAINFSGQVTGCSNITGNLWDHAFLYSNGKMTDLGTLGGLQSCGKGINSSGQIVGWAENSAQGGVAFLYTPGTGMVAIANLIPSDSGWTLSMANSINDSGQITGWGINPAGAEHGFLYSKGKITDLGTLGGRSSQGQSINAQGQITGTSNTTGDVTGHAFLWTKKTGMVDLGPKGSGGGSDGAGINASGQITGIYSSSPTTADFAFLYSGGQMTNLGTLGGDASFAYGINASGQVIGFTYAPGDLYDPGFLYTPGKGMVDVNTLIPSNSGWMLEYGLFAINDAGQITGIGDNRAFGEEGFLLTPISIDFLFHLVNIDSLRPATRRILLDTLDVAKSTRSASVRCEALRIFEQEAALLHDSPLITETKLVRTALGCD